MTTDAIPTVPIRNGQLYPLSIEAYHVLGEAGLLPKNTELLYGLVYKKMPKSPFHVALVARLLRAIEAAKLKGFMVRSEQPISCGDSEPEPDIAVVAENIDDYLRAHPATAKLVVEVCVTSHDYDRSKLRAYAMAGVEECWLALEPEKQIEVYRKPMNGAYTEKNVVGPGGSVRCEVFRDVVVKLEPLFRQ